MTGLAGRKVIVVGAGIAGLTAAFRLTRAGAEVVTLESSDRVGGRMQTERVGDYLLDTGASVLTSSYLQMRRLIADAGLTSKIVPTSGLIGTLRGTTVHRVDPAAVWPVGQLVRSGLLGPASKLKAVRLLRDVRRARPSLRWDDFSDATDWDESAEEYSRRRLDDELLEYVVGPLGRAMNLVDADQFTIGLVLFTIQHYLLGGAYFNSPEGMSFLPLGLAKDLDVRLNCRVENVEVRGDEVQVSWRNADGSTRTESADHCIVAVPARDLPRIYPQMTPEAHDYFSALRFVRSIQVMFGLTERLPEEAIWVNVPRTEHRDLFVWINDHRRAPGRAPDGKGLMTFSWRDEWCRRHWDDDDTAVADAALGEIAQLESLRGLADRVEMSFVKRWNPCAPTRSPGSTAALGRFLRSRSPADRVLYAGDYFSAATTNTSLSSGERAARQIIGS
ncbi:NAD(P)/FAD-dependent oxidoreductase [Cryptosporangium japonicum]|uniref:NAD(P)/FAD-dependent oxidoreductase n=1 Tax=Cryptosporangium japonicum TaxID=80872 RepID=A0ABN0TSP2_9ACTN